MHVESATRSEFQNIPPQYLAIRDDHQQVRARLSQTLHGLIRFERRGLEQRQPRLLRIHGHWRRSQPASPSGRTIRLAYDKRNLEARVLVERAQGWQGKLWRSQEDNARGQSAVPTPA